MTIRAVKNEYTKQEWREMVRHVCPEIDDVKFEELWFDFQTWKTMGSLAHIHPDFKRRPQ